MNFLELTSYVGDAQGYADAPDFTRNVWPLIRQKQTEIENVFLFRNDNSSAVSWSGYYEAVTTNIVRIGSMGRLTDQELEKLEHLSFYGGHLNVLYQLATASSLLPELCNLYPSTRLSSDDVDPLALGPESLAELRAFTTASPPALLHFSFAHDADPLYIFGELESLRDLARR